MAGGLPKGHARAQVRRARALRHLPVCAKAWLDGDLGASHLDVLSAVRREATADALERDEELLVGQARRLRHEGFVRAVAYWDQLADPDGAEDRDEARRARRDVYLEASFPGTWLGKITLDPISGAIVSGELERLEKELFEADWAAVRARLGREPTVLDLARSSGQRRADALVEMAARSRSAPAEGCRPAPLFSVLVGYETLQGRICELGQGAVSRSAPRHGSSPEPPGGRLSSATGSAPTPTATRRHRPARWTTSSPTPPAARRPRKMAGFSAHYAELFIMGIMPTAGLCRRHPVAVVSVELRRGASLASVGIIRAF